MCGRIKSDMAVRMRMISRRISPSSSRIVLLASTISPGSINTVFPVADSSCTIPCIFRLFIGATGMTSRPSRTEGDTSLSRIPAVFPSEIILRRMPFMLAVVAWIACLIDSNSGDALSLMFPNLSIIQSISFKIGLNDCMPEHNSDRCG